MKILQSPEKSVFYRSIFHKTEVTKHIFVRTEKNECNFSKGPSQILKSSQIDTFPQILLAHFASRDQ